jgi:hypothetical protein
MTSVQSKHRDNRQQLDEPPRRVRALGMNSANEYVTFNRKTGHSYVMKNDEVTAVPRLNNVRRGSPQSAEPENRDDD